ncbi:unnamed protein product, partial [Amoebophrya sp. A120]|eukprot:GSA120T00025745001.1
MTVGAAGISSAAMPQVLVGKLKVLGETFGLVEAAGTEHRIPIPTGVFVKPGQLVGFTVSGGSTESEVWVAVDGVDQDIAERKFPSCVGTVARRRCEPPLPLADDLDVNVPDTTADPATAEHVDNSFVLRVRVPRCSESDRVDQDSHGTTDAGAAARTIRHRSTEENIDETEDDTISTKANCGNKASGTTTRTSRASTMASSTATPSSSSSSSSFCEYNPNDDGSQKHFQEQVQQGNPFRTSGLAENEVDTAGAGAGASTTGTITAPFVPSETAAARIQQVENHAGVPADESTNSHRGIVPPEDAQEQQDDYQDIPIPENLLEAARRSLQEPLAIGAVLACEVQNGEIVAGPVWKQIVAGSFSATRLFPKRAATNTEADASDAPTTTAAATGGGRKNALAEEADFNAALQAAEDLMNLEFSTTAGGDHDVEMRPSEEEMQTQAAAKLPQDAKANSSSSTISEKELQHEGAQEKPSAEASATGAAPVPTGTTPATSSSSTTAQNNMQGVPIVHSARSARSRHYWCDDDIDTNLENIRMGTVTSTSTPDNDHTVIMTMNREMIFCPTEYLQKLRLAPGTDVACSVYTDEDGHPVADSSKPLWELSTPFKEEQVPFFGQYYGRVINLSSHGNGFIDCDALKTEYGHDPFVHQKIMRLCDIQLGDMINFTVHINSSGTPQVSAPVWRKCEENRKKLPQEHQHLQHGKGSGRPQQSVLEQMKGAAGMYMKGGSSSSLAMSILKGGVFPPHPGALSMMKGGVAPSAHPQLRIPDPMLSCPAGSLGALIGSPMEEQSARSSPSFPIGSTTPNQQQPFGTSVLTPGGSSATSHQGSYGPATFGGATNRNRNQPRGHPYGAQAAGSGSHFFDNSMKNGYGAVSSRAQMTGNGNSSVSPKEYLHLQHGNWELTGVMPNSADARNPLAFNPDCEGCLKNTNTMGHGFLACPAFPGDDVFVHKKVMERCNLSVGDRVRFNVHVSATGTARILVEIMSSSDSITRVHVMLKQMPSGKNLKKAAGCIKRTQYGRTPIYASQPGGKENP